jgi:hypothetical protein
MARFRPPRLPCVDPRFVIPVSLLSLSLFGGGLALGNAIGSSPTTTRTLTYTASYTVKGKVITVNGIKKVRVPARTVTRQGKVVTLPASTVDFVQTLPARTVNGTVIVTHRVPVTVTQTRTQTQTQTTTNTITVPVTITDTSTVTVTETVTTTVTTT